MIQVQVLGPLSATAEGHDLALGGPRQRRLLALFLIHRNEVVSVDRLLDVVFDGHPTPGAGTTLRSYVARLRKSVAGVEGAPTLVTQAPGYVMRLADEALDSARFERAVAEALRYSGRIDYLFNNAGSGAGGEVDSYTLDDWNDVIDVNLRGVAYGIQAVYPIMIRQGGGHIVNTASMAGLVASPGIASYTATKHAVVGMSKALRLEAERHGVRVSVLCPGVIRTPILSGGRYGRSNGLTEEQQLKFWEPLRPLAPEVFAERALRAVSRGKAIIVVPAWWKAFWYLERLSPTLFLWASRSSLKRMREMESTAD